MKQYARTVNVPSITEEEQAYNPDRPISSLVMTQLRQLHTAEQHLEEKDRTGINISRLHTELEASKYIRKVTKKLMERASSRPGQRRRRTDDHPPPRLKKAAKKASAAKKRK